MLHRLEEHSNLNPPPTNIFYLWIIPSGVQLDQITKYARKQTHHHFYDISLCSNVIYYSVYNQSGTLLYQNHFFFLFFTTRHTLHFFLSIILGYDIQNVLEN